MNDFLEKLRTIRSAPDMRLKPSPYLRSTYDDGSGEEPVRIRNYQAQGIMNLLQVDRMILGDDTGLGKTLSVLSAIGYVWMKEPEYVPIVLTKKSALLQWEGETHKFMKDMKTVTVDGPPHERHAVYEDFFSNYDRSRKRLLILTYDSFLKDSEESVIRDRERKPDKALIRELKDLRKAVAEGESRFKSLRETFYQKFGNLSEAEDTYVRVVLEGRPELGVRPSSITETDVRFVQDLASLRDSQKERKIRLQNLSDKAAPPKKVPGFASYMKALKLRHPEVKFMLVMDEQHVLKNHRGKIHQAVLSVSSECSRVVGMTATAVKNRLMEFFSLFRIVKPGLMPTIKKFHEDFCVVKLQSIGGGRKVPIVVGYRNLDSFVRLIEPYYLSRKKHDVAKELPQLVSREIRCKLTGVQEELYDMAEAGLLETGSEADAPEAEMLKAMTLVQQAVNHPSLIADEEGNPFEGESCKLQALLEMFQDDDSLEGAKVIVFSRFEKMITLVEQALKENKIRSVRITGKESKASDREKAKQTFQDPDSGVNVILITTAGAESINLQAAGHIVFLDSPWSWGDYVQITGRSVRIGSMHSVVIVTHLVAVRSDGGKTIDDHVIKTLRGKKALADKVTGEALKDGLKFVQGSDAADIFRMIRDGRKDRKTLLEEVNKKIASMSSRSKISRKKPDVATVAEEESARIDSIDLSDI